MKKKIACIVTQFFIVSTFSQQLLTPFEKTKGMESATYFECIDYYIHYH